MPYLIDGNNLLHAVRDLEPDRPPGRFQLCAVLGAWALQSSETVHVIFDGPEPPPGFAAQIAGTGVRVSFSGPGVSADSVLIRHLEDSGGSPRLVVVSSDREVARAARRRRAKSMRADGFWAILKKQTAARTAPTPREPQQKSDGLNPGEAGHWLRELGFESAPDDAANRRSDGPTRDTARDP